MQYKCTESYLEELCGGIVLRICLEQETYFQLQLMGATKQ